MSKPGAMSDKPEAEVLAKRFLDLWQEQFAQMMSDPALVAWTQRWLALAAPPWAPGGDGAGAFRPFGPAAPAAAPGDVAARLDELARRLAACEERLAALEPRPAAARKRARKGSRRG